MASVAFQQNLAWGQIAESAIAKWLRSRGNAVLPIYDIEYQTGKGPRLFLQDSHLVAPDLLVFGQGDIFWVECKHKSVFTWHRASQQWQTGIDRRHYRDYLQVAEKTGKPIWLFFAHSVSMPDARDLRMGSPAECPTGLFAVEVTTPIHHEHANHGPSGMVYWSHGQLKRVAELL